MGLRERLILALDVEESQRAIELVKRLNDLISFYKIGLRLFTLGGPRIVSQLKDLGVKIFLDLKLHDIPNTVADVSRLTVSMGVDMFDLHISGGPEMIRAAIEATHDEADKIGVEPPILLGVTILTSLNDTELKRIHGSGTSVAEQVTRMAEIAKEEGLDGVIASPLEIGLIRERCGDDFIIVTPGVRPRWAARGDQRRITTPARAIKVGADYIVIGRPIYAAEDPVEATIKILKEMEDERGRGT